MARRVVHLVACLSFLISLPLPCLSVCPLDCACALDHRGRRQVVCSKGGMSDPIPIQSMDHQMEVLRISAPKDHSNSLTIGPIFHGFSQLEELHIVRSNVPAIGKHSFWGVPSLLILNLTQNNITHVLDYNFRGLANLVELHLDDNRIESMPSGTFRYLQELRVLSLARNRIKELVPRLFLMLGKLHELDLSGNRLLMELNPEVFKDIQDLRKFRCRGCSLSNINTQLYNLLSDMTHLDMGDNEFKYIASDEFRDLRRLEVLHLDGNQLPVVLEKTFSYPGSDGHINLHTINLARNRLAKVTATAFANLTQLKNLDLGYNKLDRLETMTFIPMADSLRRLDLSGNAIALSEVKYVLQVVLKLRELGLADMGFSDLPLGLFVYHEHLRMLNLSGNHFSHLPAQLLSPIPKLQELDISRNRFRGLDERLLLRLEAVKIVHLQGNPWICDLCHMMPMLARVNKSTTALNYEGLTCVAPHGQEGRLITSLHKSSMEWCTSEGGIGYMEGGGVSGVTNSFLAESSLLAMIAAGVAVVLLLLTGLLVGIAYFRHHAAHYYTREDTRGPEREAIFENPTALLGENGEIKYTIVPMDSGADLSVAKPPQKKKKTVTICTIDSMAKDPELRTLTNGT
uniref:LRRCT domain-containing protein n=1 Tax=Timema douglasi TaxID=61478 RepID=A0A7R8ZFG4_TIMDO|nr:unnamed protein product [Timema douglasi]